MKRVKKVQRYNPDYKTGLTHEQVTKRKEENLINYDTTVKTKSIRSIIISNTIKLWIQFYEWLSKMGIKRGKSDECYR